MGDSYTDLIDGRKGKVAVLPDVNGTVYKTQTIFAPHIMKDGLGGVIRRAKEEKQKSLDTSRFVPNDYTAIFHKTVILDVMIMVCEALIKYARKHADLARKMASTEKDPARKKELKQIAETCEWVPENPPRTFQEALQFYWFIHLALRKEAPY